MISQWTPERVGLLKKLWDQGLSCAQIARALNCGITRNAVIGKASRLKLPVRLTTCVAGRTYVAPPRKPPPAKPVPLPAICEPEKSAPVGTCQYMHGDPRQPGWQMCGHPVHSPGKSWCAYHQGRVFLPPKPKADREGDAAA